MCNRCECNAYDFNDYDFDRFDRIEIVDAMMTMVEMH